MPQGRLWRIDSNGFILNDACPDDIQPPFDAAAADAVSAYTRHIAADIHSIYVTGSVARGLAVEGISDLNVCAVLNEPVDPDLVLQDWIPSAEEFILDSHPCISDVRLELWPNTDVFGDPAYFSISAFILKTQSVCLWGSDLAPELPEHRLSAAIANDDIVQFKNDLEDVCANLEQYPQSTRALCRRAMKTILHTGFALVMLDENGYTRDLDVCCAYFSRHCTNHAEDMSRALTYAQNPPRDPRPVLDFLNEFGGWLAVAADAWLDRHNPARELALPTGAVEDE